jgi:NitT/TauT family transport system substrate-binding protein
MTSKLLHRRQFGLLAAAGAVGAAMPAFAQTTKLRVGIIPIVDTAPLTAGIKKGFFAAEGLEIDTTPAAGGAAGLPALAAGQVQIAFSNIISIVLGASQGLGFQVIAAGVGTRDKAPDLAGLVSKKGAPYKTGKDLEGKRIAVNTRNGVLWLYAREWVRVTGGDPDKVTYLEVPFPQMGDALRGDRVDVAFITEPFLSAAISGQNMQLVGWPYNTVQKHIPVGMYASTKNYIQSNPAVIDRFARAYYKSVDWSNANSGTAEWMDIVAAHTRLPPERIKAMTATVFEKSVDPAGVDAVIQRMRANKMFEGPLDTKALLYRTTNGSAR